MERLIKHIGKKHIIEPSKSGGMIELKRKFFFATFLSKGNMSNYDY